MVIGHGDEITNDIWLKQITPKPFDKECFSEPIICKWADKIMQDNDIKSLSKSSAKDIFPIIGIYMLLAIPGTYFAYRHTRPPKPVVGVEEGTSEEDGGENEKEPA